MALKTGVNALNDQKFTIQYYVTQIGLDYLKSKQDEIEHLFIQCVEYETMYNILKQFNTFDKLKGISFHQSYRRTELLETQLKNIGLIKDILIKFTNLHHLELIMNDEVNEQLFASILELLPLCKMISSFSFKNNYNMIEPQFFSQLGQNLSARSNLTNLQLIFQSRYHFNELAAESFRQAFKNLNKLQNLTLKFYYQFTQEEKGCKPLFKGIKYLQNLEELNLSIYPKLLIHEEDLITLSRSISKLENIKELTLDFKQQKSFMFDVKSFVEGVNNKQLRKLVFYIPNSYFFHDIGISQLGKSLETLKFLIDLRLYFKNYIQITEEGVDLLVNGLQYQKILQKLHMTFNKNTINPKQFEKVAESFQYLTNLAHLKICANCKSKVGVEGAQGLGKGLKGLVNLEKLSIIINEYNYIEAEGAISIGSSFKYLKQLKKLEIQIRSENKIKAGGQFLMKGIKYLIHLEKLIIKIGQKNGFSDLGCQALGKSLRKLEKLKYLNIRLAKNNITDFGFCCLGEGISNLTKLQELVNFFPSFPIRNSFSLMEGYSQLSNLNNLYLFFSTGYQLSKIAIQNLSSCLEKMINLQQAFFHFNFSQNYKKEYVFKPQEIYKSLKKLKFLNYLSMMNYSQGHRKQTIMRNIPRLVKYLYAGN